MIIDDDVVIVHANGSRLDGKLARQIIRHHCYTANVVGCALDKDLTMKPNGRSLYIAQMDIEGRVLASHAIVENLDRAVSQGAGFLPLKVCLR